jgi:ferrous iron transport protein B
VATISAEMAKEQAIGTLAVLNGVAADAEDAAVAKGITTMFTSMSALSFMILNIFDPPCIVAISTTMREMGSKKWGWIAVGYQCLVGYALAFIFYQLGMAFSGASPFGVGQIIAVAIIALIIYFVARPAPKGTRQSLEARAHA